MGSAAFATVLVDSMHPVAASAAAIIRRVFLELTCYILRSPVEQLKSPELGLSEGVRIIFLTIPRMGRRKCAQMVGVGGYGLPYRANQIDRIAIHNWSV
jgi:hypothetical protein